MNTAWTVTNGQVCTKIQNTYKRKEYGLSKMASPLPRNVALREAKFDTFGGLYCTYISTFCLICPNSISNKNGEENLNF